jgi:hypothetical protein
MARSITKLSIVYHLDKEVSLTDIEEQHLRLSCDLQYCRKGQSRLNHPGNSINTLVNGFEDDTHSTSTIEIGHSHV